MDVLGGQRLAQDLLQVNILLISIIMYLLNLIVLTYKMIFNYKYTGNIIALQILKYK